jgi:hypothetical protein
MKAKKSRFSRDAKESATSSTEISPVPAAEEDDYMAGAFLPVDDAGSVDRINPKQRSFAEMMEINRDSAMAAPIDKSSIGFKVINFSLLNNTLTLTLIAIIMLRCPALLTRIKPQLLLNPPHLILSKQSLFLWHHRNDDIHYELPSSL